MLPVKMNFVSAPPYWTAPILSGSLAEHFSTTTRGQLPKMHLLLSGKPTTAEIVIVTQRQGNECFPQTLDSTDG